MGCGNKTASLQSVTMEQIIDPVSVDLIKAELTPEKKLCDTNKGGNEIYVIDAFDSPNTLREVGRLREIAYRDAGGCSGLSMDIDEFDTMENPYKQIIIWSPETESIIGGYRYILGPDVKFKPDGQPYLATAHQFHFSEKFIREYLPYTIELGRSFVVPDYQSSRAGARSIFALDNLWDGIGAVMMQHPKIMYFFGKMTMYTTYDKSCRALILHFLWKHFGDKEELIRPHREEVYDVDPRLLDLILKDEEYKPDYRNLKEAIHRLGSTIPPLINAYMNSSPTMKMFGTATNDELENVEDSGILISFDEMYADKRDRHKAPYIRHIFSKMKKRFPDLKEEIIEKISLRQDRLRERNRKR